MNSKEQKIKEAYLEYPILYKNIQGENGWSGDKFGVLWQKYKDDENLEVRNNEYNTNGTVRPKSLQGIESNNGWIKIESEDDLPKDFGTYWMIERRTREIVYETDLMNHNKQFIVNYFSHYQPIEKPKPPLY